MNLEDIKWYQLDELRKHKLNMNHFLIMDRISHGEMMDHWKDIKKLQEMMWVEPGSLFTSIGREFYKRIRDMEEPMKGKKKASVVSTGLYDEEWSLFWKQWPSTNNFEFRGRKFTGSRTMKAKEQVCRNIWTTAVVSGLSPDVLLSAAGAALLAKKQESIHTGENKLQYMNGLEVWLRGKMWEAWMDVKMDYSIPENKQPKVYENSTDM